MREKDSEHIQEHLKHMRNWRFRSYSEEVKTLKVKSIWRIEDPESFSDSKGNITIRRLWHVLASYEGRSLSVSDSTICPLLTMCKNKQWNSRTKWMKQITPIEAKWFQMTTQRHYLNQVTFQRLGSIFSGTQSLFQLIKLDCISLFQLWLSRGSLFLVWLSNRGLLLVYLSICNLSDYSENPLEVQLD